MAKQDRLESLKQLRAEELASSHPSHSYIQDLDQSIIDIEQYQANIKPYQIMSNNKG